LLILGIKLFHGADLKLYGLKFLRPGVYVDDCVQITSHNQEFIRPVFFFT